MLLYVLLVASWAMGSLTKSHTISTCLPTAVKRLPWNTHLHAVQRTDCFGMHMYFLFIYAYTTCMHLHVPSTERSRYLDQSIMIVLLKETYKVNKSFWSFNNCIHAFCWSGGSCKKYLQCHKISIVVTLHNQHREQLT